MGLLNFVKEAGEKIWDAVSGDSKEDRADKLKKHIDGLNLPGAEKVNIDVAEDGTATVTGDVASQEDKEKILVAVGNVTGVGQVSDGVKVTQSGAESRFYTVKSGDTLSAINDKRASLLALLPGFRRLLCVSQCQPGLFLLGVFTLLLKFQRAAMREVAEEYAADDPAHQQIEPAVPAHFIDHYAEQAGA